MLKSINFKALIGAVVSFLVAYVTAAGIIQNFINFSDPINELAFCVMSLTMGVLSLMCIKK